MSSLIRKFSLCNISFDKNIFFIVGNYIIYGFDLSAINIITIYESMQFFAHNGERGYCWTKKLKGKIKMSVKRRNKKKFTWINLYMSAGFFFWNLLEIFHITWCQIQEELHLHNIKLNISIYIYIIKFDILNKKFKVYFVYWRFIIILIRYILNPIKISNSIIIW